MAERDVVIVGGGPAGATTALALAAVDPALAARALLLEKARFPREKPCAGALGARGDALLAELGVTVDVPGAPIDGMTFRGADSCATAAPGKIGRVVRRIEFDHALVRQAAARGVEVRDGVAVNGVRPQPGGGAVVETSAGPVRASVVVGCDGVGSVVRKALGVGPGAWRAQVVEVDTPAVPGDLDRGLLHFDASDRGLPGYAWDFPTIVDGEPLVCRGVYRLRTEGERGAGSGPGKVPDVGELLAARLRAQGIDPARCKNKRYAERGFEPATRVARGPLMLAGEAAGIDAVTGEGIAQAIEYGVLAGRFLAEHLRGANRDGGGAMGGAGDGGVDGWQDVLARSRLAHDLRIRAFFLRFFYGASRPDAERFLGDSPDAVYVGCQHFAGRAYDWSRLPGVLFSGGARLAAIAIGDWLRR